MRKRFELFFKIHQNVWLLLVKVQGPWPFMFQRINLRLPLRKAILWSLAWSPIALALAIRIRSRCVWALNKSKRNGTWRRREFQIILTLKISKRCFTVLFIQLLLVFKVFLYSLWKDSLFKNLNCNKTWKWFIKF